MLVAVASPFHGYPDAYNDTEYNRRKGRELKDFYEFIGKPAKILVLVSDHLNPPYSAEDDEQAVKRCRAIIGNEETGEAGVDEVHFWYPEGCGLSPGMKGEEDLALKLGIKCRYYPEEWW